MRLGRCYARADKMQHMTVRSNLKYSGKLYAQKKRHPWDPLLLGRYSFPSLPNLYGDRWRLHSRAAPWLDYLRRL
jgi:hypothetical protein